MISAPRLGAGIYRGEGEERPDLPELCARRDIDGFAIETGTTTYSGHVTGETNRTRPSRLKAYLMNHARWHLGYGLVACLYSTYAIAKPEYRDFFRESVAMLCLFVLYTVSGGYGLVLRRRSAKSTVYVTENGAHDPQDTGNDQ